MKPTLLLIIFTFLLASCVQQAPPTTSTDESLSTTNSSGTGSGSSGSGSSGGSSGSGSGSGSGSSGSGSGSGSTTSTTQPAFTLLEVNGGLAYSTASYTNVRFTHTGASHYCVKNYNFGTTPNSADCVGTNWKSSDSRTVAKTVSTTTNYTSMIDGMKVVVVFLKNTTSGLTAQDTGSVTLDRTAPAMPTITIANLNASGADVSSLTGTFDANWSNPSATDIDKFQYKYCPLQIGGSAATVCSSIYCFDSGYLTDETLRTYAGTLNASHVSSSFSFSGSSGSSGGSGSSTTGDIYLCMRAIDNAGNSSAWTKPSQGFLQAYQDAQLAGAPAPLLSDGMFIIPTDDGFANCTTEDCTGMLYVNLDNYWLNPYEYAVCDDSGFTGGTCGFQAFNGSTSLVMIDETNGAQLSSELSTPIAVMTQKTVSGPQMKYLKVRDRRGEESNVFSLNIGIGASITVDSVTDAGSGTGTPSSMMTQTDGDTLQVSGTCGEDGTNNVDLIYYFLQSQTTGIKLISVKTANCSSGAYTLTLDLDTVAGSGFGNNSYMVRMAKSDGVTSLANPPIQFERTPPAVAWGYPTGGNVMSGETIMGTCALEGANTVEIVLEYNSVSTSTFANCASGAWSITDYALTGMNDYDGAYLKVYTVAGGVRLSSTEQSVWITKIPPQNPTMDISNIGYGGNISEGDTVSGSCWPNGMTINISGDHTGTATCSAGSWSEVVDLSSAAYGNVAINLDGSYTFQGTTYSNSASYSFVKIPPTVETKTASLSSDTGVYAMDADNDFYVLGTGNEVYVYRHNGSTWSAVKINNNIGSNIINFGKRVDISGHFLAVGATDTNNYGYTFLYKYDETSGTWSRFTNFAPQSSYPRGLPEFSLEGSVLVISGDYYYDYYRYFNVYRYVGNGDYWQYYTSTIHNYSYTPSTYGWTVAYSAGEYFYNDGNYLYKNGVFNNSEQYVGSLPSSFSEKLKIVGPYMVYKSSHTGANPGVYGMRKTDGQSSLYGSWSTIKAFSGDMNEVKNKDIVFNGNAVYVPLCNENLNCNNKIEKYVVSTSGTAGSYVLSSSSATVIKDLNEVSGSGPYANPARFNSMAFAGNKLLAFPGEAISGVEEIATSDLTLKADHYLVRSNTSITLTASGGSGNYTFSVYYTNVYGGGSLGSISSQSGNTATFDTTGDLSNGVGGDVTIEVYDNVTGKSAYTTFVIAY